MAYIASITATKDSGGKVFVNMNGKQELLEMLVAINRAMAMAMRHRNSPEIIYETLRTAAHNGFVMAMQDKDG